MSARDDLDEDLQPTLEAYERQMWAQLNDSGRDPLLQERANLAHFLAQADDLDWASQRLIRFRRAKLEVLEAILAEPDP